MIPSKEAIALYHKVINHAYGIPCLEGKCKELKKCNKRGYCVKAAKDIQKQFDKIAARTRQEF